MPLGVSLAQYGRLQVAARARTVRLLVWVAALAAVFYFVYELSPLLEQEATTAHALSSAAYRLAEKEARESITAPGEKKTSYFEYPASELVVVSVPILAFGSDKQESRPGQAVVKLRPDRLILWVGTFAVLLAVLTTILSGQSSVRLGPFSVMVGADTGEPPASQESVASLTPVQLFAKDVDAAGRRADALFSRSTLLLSGGIIMSFVGVGIFYVTLPETKADETLTTYWPKIVRPTGVLIFVEAIAWFLLRQYRSLVEDYKWFYRLYLKRSNFLAASRVLGSDPVRPEDLFIAVSLVQEDYSGRLKPGETTESLELLRMPEDSPITEALRSFSALKEGAKPKKPDEAAKKSDS